jgi:hypothetical protein
MKQLDLGKHRKARVWLNELPDVGPLIGAVQELEISATSQSVQANRAAVEVFVPLGPRSMYGLLGGEYTPLTTGQLKVMIISSPADEKSLFVPLTTSDRARIGLPAEYCEAVKEGIRLAEKEVVIAPGQLVISYATYGEIGSCAAVFKHLAAVLLKLINIRKHDPTDGEIISLFPQSFA